MVFPELSELPRNSRNSAELCADRPAGASARTAKWLDASARTGLMGSGRDQPYRRVGELGAMAPELLRQVGFAELPGHVRPGGFDHAAVHRATARAYIAHTANDAVDVLDCKEDRYLYSIPGLTGVAGALVAEEESLVFTSNRGENTVGIFAPDTHDRIAKVGVGLRPNGLAYAPSHGLLVAANVGDSDIAGSHTVSIVDVRAKRLVAEVPVPGRTRWAVYDPDSEAFYVNIAAPAQIVVIDARRPTQIADTLDVPVPGPHGLELDSEAGCLYCACDGKALLALELRSGRVLAEAPLSGVPDVVFHNPALGRIYVAIGDPGVVEVFDSPTLVRSQVLPTEPGAHTLAFDPDRHKIYALLPQTHRAAVYIDGRG
jgi:DNA-binding beta-propeller fold protein YncE